MGEGKTWSQSLQLVNSKINNAAANLENSLFSLTLGLSHM